MKRRIHPSMPRPLAARIAAEESGDIKARWMLLDRAENCYDEGKEGRRAAATLIHAERYLADRDEYTRDPWPKNMVQFPYVASGDASALLSPEENAGDPQTARPDKQGRSRRTHDERTTRGPGMGR